MPKGTKAKKKEKFLWGGIHPFFYHPFLFFFIPDLKKKVILDCGSGKGVNGYLIRATRDLKGSKLIGLEVNDHYLSFCKKHRVYDKLVKHSLPKLPFKNKTIDFLLCIEVIEHFNKKEGEQLLSEIDRVCKGRALLSTPNVPFQTEPGEYEDAHHSFWAPGDFRSHNYKVYGIGIKTAILQNDPLFRLKQALGYIFTPISYLIPEIGGYLICVKDYS